MVGPDEPPERLPPLYWLLTCQGLVAAASLTVEIVGGRMLAPYVGMSLYTWTAVIAVVLAGLSAGHWAGGLLAERPPRQAVKAMGLALGAAAVTTAITGLLLKWLAGPIATATGNIVLEIIALGLAVFFLPSFFAGVPSPVIARLAVIAKPDQQGRALGNVFAAGAIGAIAGTLLAGYLFISWLGTGLTIVLVSVVYAVLAFVLLVQARAMASAAVTGLVAAVALLPAVWALTKAGHCTRESQYYCIRSVDYSREAGSEARLMVIDHLGHSINVRNEPGRLTMPYVAAIDRMVMAYFGGVPKSSFFIGGGAYTLPRAWASGGATGIVVAEIDPAVTRLAIDDFWLDPGAMTILHHDARRALRDQQARFDVIVGDAFTDIAIPAHLVTREFFELVSDRLSGRGLYAMNVVDHAGHPHALLAIAATLNQVFANVIAFAEAGDLAAGARTTFAVFASDSALPSKLPAPPGDQRVFRIISSDWFKTQVTRRKPVILTDDIAPVARLLGTRKF